MLGKRYMDGKRRAGESAINYKNIYASSTPFCCMPSNPQSGTQQVGSTAAATAEEQTDGKHTHTVTHNHTHATGEQILGVGNKRNPNTHTQECDKRTDGSCGRISRRPPTAGREDAGLFQRLREECMRIHPSLLVSPLFPS